MGHWNDIFWSLWKKSKKWGRGRVLRVKCYILDENTMNLTYFSILTIWMGCCPKMFLKSILTLKIHSRGPKNTCTYVGYHLRTLRSSLKNHQKSHFLIIFAYNAKSAQMSYIGASRYFKMQLWLEKVDKIPKVY